MDSKDARESLESGGGGSRCRCSNGRRNVAAVLAIHSLFIAACAAFILNIYLRAQPEKQHDTGIFLQMTEYVSDEVSFLVTWNHEVDLIDKKRVKLNCAGPYMVYLWACAKGNSDAVVNVTLEQGTKLFHLQTLRGNECKEMQEVIMLSEKDEVTVKVNHIIDRLFLGLHYMLGAQCFYHPLDYEQLEKLGYKNV